MEPAEKSRWKWRHGLGTVALLSVGATVVFLASLQRASPQPAAIARTPPGAPHSGGAAVRPLDERGVADGGLEKVHEMCGNCYKMNRCSELALGNYSDAKQACLCAGEGPWAQKPCQIQCAKTGPHPIEEVKLMPCAKTACNHCSRNCGGGNYWSNPGTIANWPYSPTYTSGKTWSRVWACTPMSRAHVHNAVCSLQQTDMFHFAATLHAACLRDTVNACVRIASTSARTSACLRSSPTATCFQTSCCERCHCCDFIWSSFNSLSYIAYQ